MTHLTDPHWREEALCAQTDPEVFFPEIGKTPHLAKQICAGCPVRTACLAEALEHRDTTHGVLGGLTANERRKLLRTTSAACRRAA